MDGVKWRTQYKEKKGLKKKLGKGGVCDAVRTVQRHPDECVKSHQHVKRASCMPKKGDKVGWDSGEGVRMGGSKKKTKVTGRGVEEVNQKQA